jgi:predicted Co/Zn/Cd cation transporter (cation efflux family)
MMITVLVSVSCALSVAATACAIYALKVADPILLRSLSAKLSHSLTELQNEVRNVKEVEFGHLEARCEALLERAETRFESAEHKRKSVAARGNRNAAVTPDNAGPVPWLDESLSRQERHAALERAARGGR